MNKSPMHRNMMYVLLAMMFFFSYKQFSQNQVPNQVISYSVFLDEVRAKHIKSVVLTEGSSRIKFLTLEGKTLETTGSEHDRDLINNLVASNVAFEVKERPEPSFWLSMLVSWGPMLFLIGVWIFFMRKMQGGKGGFGAFSFGKSKAKMLDEANNTTTFLDVAGCDEAKEEVKELVDFLKSPHKFQKLGGRIPRGLLLVGPPGTGKTLLAKAIAGEAKVPFFSISGSDFVEMFVGVGASRVRDMFEQAKKTAPCILFVDEIDAVGRRRGAGHGGGNDEREQTLNQMLVEMDGFETSVGVIVVAATNRPDVLDPALLRPGRFDRQVYVSLPDIRGREQILLVHMRKIPTSANVQAGIIARGTPGFSGADLANLVNEAALFAVRRGGENFVEMVDFEKAKEKIMMGPERRSMLMPEEERRNTAYHEAGHTLVARLMPKCDPVHKVTIIPRGRALGVTMQLPEADRYSSDKIRMSSTLALLFGGRIAEEVFMDQMTTGASNDFERATKMARDMVAKYGMSDALGVMVYADDESEAYFGRSSRNVSEATLQRVDDAVRLLIDKHYQIARDLIEANKDKMHAMANALLEWETIDTEQIDDIMSGKPPRPPKDWTPSVNSSKHVEPPSLPPVQYVPGVDPETVEMASEIGIALPPPDKKEA